jgi:hypothetical protein
MVGLGPTIHDFVASALKTWMLWLSRSMAWELMR